MVCDFLSDLMFKFWHTECCAAPTALSLVLGLDGRRSCSPRCVGSLAGVPPSLTPLPHRTHLGYSYPFFSFKAQVRGSKCFVSSVCPVLVICPFDSLHIPLWGKYTRIPAEVYRRLRCWAPGAVPGGHTLCAQSVTGTWDTPRLATVCCSRAL